jgi:hypothetical protein
VGGQIDLPRDGATAATIQGLPADVKAAAAAIKALKAVTRVAQVPADVRPQIIGAKGSGVLALQKQFQVFLTLVKSTRETVERLNARWGIVWDGQ